MYSFGRPFSNLGNVFFGIEAIPWPCQIRAPLLLGRMISCVLLFRLILPAVAQFSKLRWSAVDPLFNFPALIVVHYRVRTLFGTNRKSCILNEYRTFSYKLQCFSFFPTGEKWGSLFENA